MSAPHSVQSIPDTALGLTQGELQILRHQQQVMAQRSHQSAGGDRGRGTSRHSAQPSSRGASAASSQTNPHRVVLEPRQLQALQAHLDNVMRAIENRIGELEHQTQTSVNASSGRHGQTADQVEAAVRRMRSLLKEIDQLEDDLDRVKNIKHKVKEVRQRVDATSDRMDRSSASQHGSSRHSGPTSDRHRR